MRTYLIAFLKQLEAAVPPPGGVHHTISFGQYGSDEAGWQDRLCVYVWVGTGGTPLAANATELAERFVCLFVDDADFEQTPEELAAMCAEAVGQ